MGGKFANLVRLQRSGSRVPMGFAVTTFAYRKFMMQLDSEVGTILSRMDPSDLSSAEMASSEITELVGGTPVPGVVAESIAGAYDELSRAESPEGLLPVAVRSSATAEDMLSASVAGQHETFLWVRGRDEVVRRARECWASAFTTRSLTYRRARGISQAGVEMAVVVQKMVESVKSGVMFTLNPANGDRSKVSIDAAWGLGEGVVGGVVTPDLFVVDKVTMEILTRRVGSKKVEFVPEEKEVVTREVPSSRRGELCLGDDEVVALARVGKSLEKTLGKPQDIEWAMDDSQDLNSRIYVLQARPETVWSAKGGAKTEPKDALDRVVDTLKKGQRIR